MERKAVRQLLPAFDGEHGFKRRPDVLAEADSRAAFIEKKMNVLRSWIRETADVEELSGARATIEGLLR